MFLNYAKQACMAMNESDILSRLLHRDGLVLVLNKPAGLPVLKPPHGGDYFERYFTHLQFGLKSPPALAHRLDSETSGCLVLGRHAKPLRKLAELFQNEGVEKTYWAVVHGVPAQAAGSITAPLARASSDPKDWTMRVDEAAGQASRTDYKVLKTIGTKTLVEVYPKTGRTHQIRVHMAHIGCPLVGEKIYKTPKDQTPLLLHAKRVVFKMQASKPPLDITAPLPANWPEEFRG